MRNEKRKEKKRNLFSNIYIVFFLVLCLAPLVLLGPLGGGAGIPAGTETGFPGIVDEDGTFNWHFLSDAGDWFSAHYGLSDIAANADSTIREKVFSSSGNSDVIIGKNGYLFRADTLNDYTGNNALSGSELRNIAWNLRVLQDSLEDEGRAFVLAVVPNKNSIYAQFMPDKFANGHRSSNAIRLMEMLDEFGVNHTDLFNLFSIQDAVMYHKLDSRWDNRAARLASDSIMTLLNKNHEMATGMVFKRKQDLVGDLYKMIYPAGDKLDVEYNYDPGFKFRYTSDGENDGVTDEITTKCDGRLDSVIVFRDEFGDQLIPFIADSYKTALFTRALPIPAYRAINESYYDVVYEIAERNIPDLAVAAPVLQTSEAELDPEDIGGTEKFLLEVNRDDPYPESGLVRFYGTYASEYPDAEEETYIRFTDTDINDSHVFPVYRMKTEVTAGGESLYGFEVYMDERFSGKAPSGGDWKISIIFTTNNGARIETAVK